MLRIRTAAIAIAATASLVTATATTADAAGSVTVHKIKGKTIKKSARTTIRPKVSHKAHVKVESKTITVRKRGKVIVDHRSSARLRPGSYRVTTNVDYKVSRMVTKTRQLSQLRYHTGASVAARCSIDNVVLSDDTRADLTLGCHAADFTSDGFSGRVSAYYDGDTTWTAVFNDNATQILSASGPAALVGKPVAGLITSTSPVHELSTEKYQKREYGSSHHVSKSQSLKIKAKKAKKAKSKHACTTTASGTCIAGGQFCPQAKYGKSGWDGSGRRYVCTGDRTHPHWMKP